jgi:hypothetical protein
VVIVQVSGSVRGTRVFAIIAVSFVSVALLIVSILHQLHEVAQTVWSKIGGRRWRRSFGWRGIDHQLEAVFCRRKLRDVMLWMSSSNVLLHGPISLFLLIELACYHN